MDLQPLTPFYPLDGRRTKKADGIQQTAYREKNDRSLWVCDKFMGNHFSKSVIPRLDRGIQTIKELDCPVKPVLRLDRGTGQ
ncbi:MAG: hypothetical protein CO150_02865 [Nitrospirae bacterium CG_4_9_14_3_um_filter_53_35]|nr:MAG: hypothetical protein AUK29_04570 [Nitrospirae bacterium CG2_30_53_67]PIS38105.1 MAG: hypothetical protein COT35_02855 [Nitrospirae bacterium CG08_land_8_20_14_0_20_52_24]PIV83231.1 MAG: hypothetical protein COW52_09390 [Nitrospirae bacterium CG17_big_fil_post_rev_8_21_14_2_50_50_9]PIW84483.1 MAG: hypothetical protein COZ95_09760 [Nitrospirae bacterium CG_4_8_14_3_um_filter_50_41]PIX86979.1 MAG: hypothetical protein COZ32_00345 [Nitrospirae bacterium CG_4_10_14_3_um_filter_53_41]PJA7663